MIEHFVDRSGGDFCSLDFPVDSSDPFSLLLGREPRNKIILAQRHFTGGESLAQFWGRAGTDPPQPARFGGRVLLRQIFLHRFTALESDVAVLAKSIPDD